MILVRIPFFFLSCLKPFRKAKLIFMWSWQSFGDCFLLLKLELQTLLVSFMLMMTINDAELHLL